jgi:hypothetical protein
MIIDVRKAGHNASTGQLLFESTSFVVAMRVRPKNSDIVNKSILRAMMLGFLCRWMADVLLLYSFISNTPKHFLEQSMGKHVGRTGHAVVGTVNAADVVETQLFIIGC